MGKKRKRSRSQDRALQANTTLMKQLDQSIAMTHDKAMDELKESMRKIHDTDTRLEMRERTRLRRNMGLIPYYTADKEMIESRVKEAKRLEKIGVLGNLEEGLRSLARVIVVGARLIALFITTVIRFQQVTNFLPVTLVQKMESIYQLAMKVSL